MKQMSHLLWALGINGEGSSHVTFAFIKHIFLSYRFSNNRAAIVYSASSSLDELIASFLLNEKNNISCAHVRLIRLPKFFRNYLIHFMIKAFINPLRFFDSVVVFDDFPFKHADKQILYFHQPNLIYNNSILWCIKRFAFRLLLTSHLIVYIQTLHMRDAFTSRFGQFKTMCFLHGLR